MRSLSNTRLTRRRLLASALAAGGAGGVALAGCGGEEAEQPAASETGTPSAGKPKRGGTLRVAITATILSLDPQTTEGVGTAPYFYSYLVHATDWQGNVGDVAASWEIVDGLEWVVTLREDVNFQDIPPANGRRLVAEDVVKSIDRYRSLPVTGTWNQWVDRYEAPDAATFVLRTKTPYGYVLPTLVGSTISGIVCMEAVEEFGDLRNRALGSGPYVLAEFDRDKGLEMLRNPGYYHDFPYLDGISVRVMSDEASIQAAFRSGALDTHGASNRMKAEAVKDVKGVDVHRFLDRAYACIRLNAVKFEPFKDQRVREAFDIALDRRAMIERLHFGDAELAGPVPPAWETSLPKEEVEQAYKRDVARARQLLSAAGHDELSVDLSMGNYGDMPDQAAIIKANLAEAGIKVNLQPAELGTWLANMLLGNFQATVFSHLKFLSDEIPLQSHHSLGSSREQRDYLGVDDAEVDALLDKAQQTLDDEERKQIAWEAERLILKRHGPTLHLYQPYAYLCIRDYVKGFQPSAFGLGLFKYDYWLDEG